VGALGSRANNAKRRERLLRHFDLSQAEVAALRGPAGLPIGSRTPPEIAVSILAEMTAVRHGVRGPEQPDVNAEPRPGQPETAGCRIE
jgi:xanthine dehydrogenase accessory factor